MSTSQKRKELNILHNIENNVFRNKKWKCMHPGCTEHAINSHLLQRHGLLDNLTNDGHLYEIKYLNPNYWMNNPIRFEFKRVGINDAISRPIFCKHHDNALFKKIENENTSWQNYEAQLLLSYRALCCALRKAEMCIEIHKRINNSSTLSIKTEEYFDNNLLSIKLELENEKQFIEKELHDPKDNFIFNVYDYPYTGIYASAALGEYNNSNIINHRFIHLLPLKKQTCCIIGYDKKNADETSISFMESWSDLSNLSFGHKVTYLFTNIIEDFGFSPELYKRISPSQKERIKQYMTSAIREFNISSNFNLFENIF